MNSQQRIERQTDFFNSLAWLQNLSSIFGLKPNRLLETAAAMEIVAARLTAIAANEYEVDPTPLDAAIEKLCETKAKIEYEKMLRARPDLRRE